MRVLTLLFFVLPFFLLAEEISVDREKLKQHIGKTVCVKGFLYKIDQRYVLAQKPNLKSCCIKKEKTLLFVEGENIVQKSHLTSLKGVLSFDKKKNIFFIKEAKQINKKMLLPWKTLIVLFMIVVLSYFFLFRI